MTKHVFDVPTTSNMSQAWTRELLEDNFGEQDNPLHRQSHELLIASQVEAVLLALEGKSTEESSGDENEPAPSDVNQQWATISSKVTGEEEQQDASGETQDYSKLSSKSSSAQMYNSVPNRDASEKQSETMDMSTVRETVVECKSNATTTNKKADSKQSSKQLSNKKDVADQASSSTKQSPLRLPTARVISEEEQHDEEHGWNNLVQKLPIATEESYASTTLGRESILSEVEGKSKDSDASGVHFATNSNNCSRRGLKLGIAIVAMLAIVITSASVAAARRNDRMVPPPPPPTTSPTERVWELDDVLSTVPETICMERVPGEGWTALCTPEQTLAKNGGGVCNLVARGFLDQVEDADVCIQNAGACRNDIAAGEFTFQNATILLPFANGLFLLEMKGSEIQLVLEQAVDHVWSNNRTGGYPYAAGLRFGIDATADFPHRVQDLEINPRFKGNWLPIEPERYYTVLANSYLVSNGDSYLAMGNVTENLKTETFLDATETFVQYAFQKGVLLDPPAEEYSTQYFVPNLSFP